MLDFDKFEVLTFDCYGTLIDWETGILNSLKPILANHRVSLDDDEILEHYAAFESKAEQGEFAKYRTVLQTVVKNFGQQVGFSPLENEVTNFPDTMQNWLPFPDTVDALKALSRRYKLAIISNVDEDLFAYSARHLQVKFDWIITADHVGSYKPSLRTFEFAFERIGIAQEAILHVAQSLYHDHVPAKKLGLATVWVNRRKGIPGRGATPPASATPDIEVPDLKSLVSLIGIPQ